jgi:hypothetical protein
MRADEVAGVSGIVHPAADPIEFESKDRSVPEENWRHYRLCTISEMCDDGCDVRNDPQTHDATCGG